MVAWLHEASNRLTVLLLAAFAGDGLDLNGEFACVNGFNNISIAAGFKRLFARKALRKRGDGDDWDVPGLCVPFQDPGEGKTVHPWKGQIQKNDLGLSIGD